MNRLADPTFEELRRIKIEIQNFVMEEFVPTSEHIKNYYVNICKKNSLVKISGETASF